jgi:putative methionine-R-sulfoxide reductase with GAF domain
MKKYIARLGKGELPEEIKVSGTDEIEDMKKSINKLTANLKLTRDFVIEVGNGNFKKEINVFNGKGELGSNLINMRKKLLQVSSERELQAKENEQRMWHNEGIGLFSEILRTNNDNLEELSYMIVKNLVKYTKSNQGGIFIKNQHNNTKITYDLKAAYAYDRRKFADSNIALGEGLIGTCAIEAETIYMTDIPDNYIKITSGLGGANPNSLLIVPLKREEEVLGMIEIASFNKYQPYEIAFVEKIADSVASHLYFVQMNIKTNELLAKTQQQSEEMAAQEEEMRQNIEELQATQEESSRRAENFEQQIIELQKTNEKLEEQLEKAKATIKTFEKKSHKK